MPVVLSERSTEPEWLELIGGSAVYVLPPSTPLVYAARAEAEDLLIKLVEAGEVVTKAGAYVQGAVDLSDERVKAGMMETLFVLSLAELAISDWKGVVDSQRTPIKFRSPALAHYLSDPTVADAFRQKYLKPIHEVVSEGNVSRPSPNGTSARAGEKPIAKAVTRPTRRAPR